MRRIKIPFVKGDPNINRTGLNAKDKESEDKPKTNRALKNRELLMLLRKMKPHVSDAIMSAAKIMKNNDAKDTDKLKAAVIILDNYRKLTLDVYDGDEDKEEEGEEIQQQNAPVFSLTVLKNEEK